MGNILGVVLARRDVMQAQGLHTFRKPLLLAYDGGSCQCWLSMASCNDHGMWSLRSNIGVLEGTAPPAAGGVAGYIVSPSRSLFFWPYQRACAWDWHGFQSGHIHSGV